MSKRLDQIEVWMREYSSGLGVEATGVSDIAWLLDQLRKAEDEITQACEVACHLCRNHDEWPLKRSDGWWNHVRTSMDSASICVASSVHERRYQRQQESK